jgi:hypothetical protein
MADVTSPFGFPYPEDTDLVRDGASDIENLAEGVNDYLTGGYLYAGTRYYTSSGTFAKADPLGTGDIGLRAIRVRMVGGGGGSGGIDGSAGQGASSGGGGGGYSEKFILASSLTTSETVNRGAGGTAGASGGAGGTGGTSEFGSIMSATGGVPSAGMTRTTGEFNGLSYAGGTGVGGDINISGGSSGPGQVIDGARRLSCNGGSSVLGQATNPAGFTTTTAGSGPGSGAAGSVAAANQGGAAGANGIVIIDCFV